MFLTGKPPYPVERTLLTSGLSAAGIDSLGQGQKRLDTASSPASGLPVAPGIDLHAELVHEIPTTRPETSSSQRTASPHRKKLAIVTTVWRYLSHAQHMGDRFLVGYPHEGKWHRPQMDVVAIYVDQKPEGDQSTSEHKAWASRFTLPSPKP